MADDDICPKAENPAECPHTGPDFDFAAPPVLGQGADGKPILVAISKADQMFGFDPDHDGAIVWRKTLGLGSRVAGVWGLAANAGHVYAGSADVRPAPGVIVGGLTALDTANGDTLWHAAASPAVCGWGDGASALAMANGAVGCSPAQPGAVTLVPGAVFSGSVDGHMRAFSTVDGRQIWDFDTGRLFKTVNGAAAAGGSISNGAEAVAHGTLYVNSGSGGVHQPGNALIAFTVDGR
jgi:polyvinyl alcohol dehydrogenase (cytochrome)